MPLDTTGQSGVVEVLLLSTFGQELSGEASITVRKTAGGQDVFEDDGSRRITLEYGTYTMRVSYPGAYTEERVVTVDQEYQVVFFSLRLWP